MDSKFKIALSFATEDQELVERVYHYLKAENINVFFAPSPEGQIFLSGKNQREAFYNIFGMNAEYVALFVSKHYVSREVPMEEASIAFAKHADDGSVIPIYIDGTPLPIDMLNPKNMNYYRASSPAVIASHLAKKIRAADSQGQTGNIAEMDKNVMNISGNKADKQIFIQNMKGSIKL